MNAKLLSKYLTYDPETGNLFWKERSQDMFEVEKHSAVRVCNWWNGLYAGKQAMTQKDQDGYLLGSINGKSYRAHRVIWAIIYGDWPSGQIDHINGCVTDNRPDNLRSVTNAENGKNQKRSVKNKSGVTGVHWLKENQKWRAAIKVSGKTTHLGLFDEFDDAVAARRLAETKNGFHRNHGRADA